MSTLVLMLTAAMAVPGNGPEQLSGETEQRLDLSGEWEGTWEDRGGRVWDASLANGTIGGTTGNGRGIFTSWEFLDEGGGRIRVTLGGSPHLGIYKREGDSIILCFRWEGEQRPVFFQGGDEPGRALGSYQRVELLNYFC